MAEDLPLLDRREKAEETYRAVKLAYDLRHNQSRWPHLRRAATDLLKLELQERTTS